MATFTYSSGSRPSSNSVVFPLNKITRVGLNIVSLPPNAIGFTYVLCGGGGGGGNGGSLCGGGGAAAGETVTATVLIAELLAALSLTRIQATMTVTISGAVYPNQRGGPSTLAIGASTLEIAQGGYGGLVGSPYQGWGPWVGGTTYTSAGGMGQVSQLNGTRVVPELGLPPIVPIATYGNGGNGGSVGAGGSVGHSGYCSIQFF